MIAVIQESGKSDGRINGTVVNLKGLAHECTIVAMEQIDDAGLGGRIRLSLMPSMFIVAWLLWRVTQIHSDF